MFAEGITIEWPWILGAGGTLVSAIVLLFKLLMSAKDKTIADLEAENKDLKSKRKSYEEIAVEGLKSARDTANWYREREGKPPIIPLAPVVSESHSASTSKQREEAKIATMRAAMAQVKLAVGQEPRPEPEQAVEKGEHKGA